MVYQITALGRNGFNSDITTSSCFLGVKNRKSVRMFSLRDLRFVLWSRDLDVFTVRKDFQIPFSNQNHLP